MSKNRKKVFVTFYLALVSAIILAVASFAWMSLSSSPVVSDLSLTIVSDNALEIAPDVDGTPGEWGSILDLSDPSKSVTSLQPVTFSAEQFAFQIVKYSMDGLTSQTVPIRLADQDFMTASGSSAAADAEVSSQYVYTCSFYVRTEATNCIVSLSSPKQTDSEHPDGRGSFLVSEPIWDSSANAHVAGGNGAENAFRMGFFIPGNAIQPDVFVIYEPNADGGFGTATYSIDGSDKLLEGNCKLIKQKCTTFIDFDPADPDRVLYSQGDFYDEDTTLFKLNAGEEKRITLFLWLEGQDDDCDNTLSEGRVLSNLQFTAIENTEDFPIFPD